MRSLASAVVVALVAGCAVAAAPYPRIEVLGAWSRPAAAGGTGAGFMTISNPTRTADALVAVQTPLARGVEMHRSTTAGGMASMQKLARIEVPAGRNVTLAPGGYHLMLLGLARPLKVGETFPVTLTFASGTRVKATFKVGLAAPAAEHAHH